jgi:3-isopropylmalate dehydrogenase
MNVTVVALPGDGVGEEVVCASLTVLRQCALKHQLDIQIEEYSVGGRALEEHGEPLPDFVVEACKRSRIVLLGAVGDTRYDNTPPHLRPEQAILRLRKELELFANLRPIKTSSALLESSPLKRTIVEGVDILIVRELTGGIYFGEPRGIETRAEGRVGINSEIYFDYEVERIARVAFEASQERRNSLTSVDKSNVLESSQLWRSVVMEVAEDFPGVSLDHMLVDNCAMQLISRPKDFDVLLTSNMFGDILSDEAAMLTGSIGMLPSASLGQSGAQGRIGLYEPIHGTAPDIAGQDKANPLATIASVALLFRYSLGRDDIAREIEGAVERTLDQGYRTADIITSGGKELGTRAMADRVLAELDR